MHNRWSHVARRWATAALVGGLGLVGSASATLVSRGPDLVYDDVLNITWTRNANLPGSSDRSWSPARFWADNLVFAGYDDWRLPTIDLTAPNTNPTDCAVVSAADCAASRNELGFMFYHNLAGLSGDNKTGTQTAVGGEVLTGIQPFYWSGTFLTNDIFEAWIVIFKGGLQGSSDSANHLSVWAVRSGDVRTNVSEPKTIALLLPGLGLLAWRSKRR